MRACVRVRVSVCVSVRVSVRARVRVCVRGQKAVFGAYATILVKYRIEHCNAARSKY